MRLRQSFRQPIPEIEVAAENMRSAVAAHLQGRHRAAEKLFRLANCSTVRDWLESIWGAGSVHTLFRQVPGSPPKLAKAERSKPRQATRAMERAIHDRDGYYCRFCGVPVIRRAIRIAAHRAYPGAVPWNDKNVEQHAGFQCMWAQYDHVVPHARGGATTLENLALTCAACNYGRGFYTLEEVSIAYPTYELRRQGDWDGLEGFR